MKKIHRAAVATALATLLVSGVNPVLAAGEGNPVGVEQQKPVVPAGMISEAQAIAAMKAMIGAEEAGKLAQVSAHYNLSSRFDTPVWTVQLMKQPEPGKFYASSVYGEVDAKTGLVKRFQFQQEDWTGVNYPTVEQARQIADAFLKAKRPDLQGRIKVADWNGGGGGVSTGGEEEVRWTQRTVRYHEMVDGIPFLSNTVHVSVDEYGHVVGMEESLNFDTKKLPPRSMVLPVSKVEKVLSHEIQMLKQYRTTHYKKLPDGEYSPVEHLALGYRPDELLSIDAITGKPVEEYYRTSLFNEKRELFKVTGTDGQWIAKDKEDAKKIVSQLLNIDLSKLNFHEEKAHNTQHGGDLWLFNWDPGRPMEPKPGQLINVGASFDAATGRLQTAHVQLEHADPSNVTVSLSEARKKALDTIATQLGSGQHELMMLGETDRTKPDNIYPKWFDKTKNEYQSWLGPNNLYSFYVAQAHQGVPVVDQTYVVDIDAVTGQLRNISLARNPEAISKLPKNENTIGDQEAEDKLFDTYSLELAYVWPQFYDQIAPEGQLVYRLGGDRYLLDYVDAFTGEVVEGEE